MAVGQGWVRPGQAAWGRRRAGRPRRGRLGRFLLLILAVYLLVVVIDQRLQMAALERQQAEVLARMRYVEERNGALRQDATRLGSDAYIEELARDALGLVGPGEAPGSEGAPQPAAGGGSDDGTGRDSGGGGEGGGRGGGSDDGSGRGSEGGGPAAGRGRDAGGKASR